MFDLITTLANAHGVSETAGFFIVMICGGVLMPLMVCFLGDVFSSEGNRCNEGVMPPEAYRPRSKRNLI